MTTLVLLGFALLHQQTSTVQQSGGGQQSGPYSSVPLIALGGPDGHFSKPSIELIRDANDWRTWWARLKGTTEERLAQIDPPFVDFKLCTVVAVAQGATSNSSGVAFPEIVIGGGSVTVRFVNMTFQSGREGVPCNPWGFAVLHRPMPNAFYETVKVKVEENVQYQMGQSPIWKQRAEFEVR